MPVAFEMVELVDHGAIGALAREGADMGFEHDGFVPRPAAPVFRAPAIRRDRSPRSGRTTSSGWKRGGRIGHVDLVVDPELVARAGVAPAMSAENQPSSPRRSGCGLSSSTSTRLAAGAQSRNDTPFGCQPWTEREVGAAHSCRARKGQHGAGRRLGLGARGKLGGRLHDCRRCSAPAASSCIRAFWASGTRSPRARHSAR